MSFKLIKEIMGDTLSDWVLSIIEPVIVLMGISFILFFICLIIFVIIDCIARLLGFNILANI
jgi:hypothetical protein